MTTYRRFTCVERSIAMFLSQDYEHDKELIIYNTDIEFPISLDKTFSHLDNIKVINNNIDLKTKNSYNNVSSIRRDAKEFANGDYYITWDDDDIFFPWNIRQCVDGMDRSGKLAWKPAKSFMKNAGWEPQLYFNYLEASVIVSMDAIERFGFKDGATGSEHLGWFEKLSDMDQMCVDEQSVPGYCFYWADNKEIGGHKQSDASEFYREDNFERHKEFTTDYAKRPFTKKSFFDYSDIHLEFMNSLKSLRDTKNDLYEKYIKDSISAIEKQ
jgi:hypothetical protein